MARNKYPEVTVEKILEVSQRLFIEKGYDNTIIQDIVDELDGLTKGAVYHHFKSKEEILDALGDKMFFENNPFTAVRRRDDLNGLQKLREVIKVNNRDESRAQISRQSIPLLKNSRILAGMIDADRRIIAPLWRELLEEGVRDGSIRTAYTRELSELIPLLTNLWLAPSVYPASAEELLGKFTFIGELFERMGVPLIDEEIMELAQKSFAAMEMEGIK